MSSFVSPANGAEVVAVSCFDPEHPPTHALDGYERVAPLLRRIHCPDSLNPNMRGLSGRARPAWPADTGFESGPGR